MGSQQPEQPEDRDDHHAPLPFGYSLGHAFTFNEQPPPPPGDPLLSADEQGDIDNFMAQVLDSNNANMNLPFGDGLNFTDNWGVQLLAHGTSLGTPGAGPMDMTIFPELNQYFPESMSMPPPPPAPLYSDGLGPSADVLAGATALLRNPNGVDPAMVYNSGGLPQSSMPMGPPLGSAPHFISGFGIPDRHSAPRNDQEFMFSDMMFGNRSEPRPAPRRPQPHAEVQYGSDPNFGGQPRYEPQSYRDSFDAMTKQQQAVMECLTRTDSAATTRQSSPVPHIPAQESAYPAPPLQSRSADRRPRPEGREGRPPASKKRRTDSRNDPTEEVKRENARDAPASAPPVPAPDPMLPRPAKRGRPRKVGTPTEPAGRPRGRPLKGGTPTEPTGKQRPRKSGQNNSDPSSINKPRQNLTEEEKRRNHIRSEQKRRTMIKDGFDDLCALVPTLKGGGMSKSVILTTVGDWLEELMEVNARLRTMN